MKRSRARPSTRDASLTSAEVAALAKQGVIRSFPKNAVIINEGDETSSFYVIIAGRVRVFVSDEDGRELVLRTHGPGDYFGEIVIDGGARSASIMTLEPSQFAVVPVKSVREFLRAHPSFAIELVEKLAHRVRELTASVKSLALMDVYGRVARLLLDLAEPADGKLIVAERPTQQEMANRVGASREMISRILKDLADGGYITVQGRRIVIHKRPDRQP